VKKIIIGFLLVLFLSLGGIAFYLINTDWVSQHREKIAEQFYNSTGKVIRFDGNIGFRFFPTPYLHANNVKIFHNENINNKPFAEIRALDAELALKPLFKKEFEITKMELKGAVFNIDWDNGFSWQSDLSPDQKQLMENDKLSLSNTLIKDGEVIFESAANDLSFHLKNLNGEISAESMFGPFRMEGNYVNGNSPEGFALTIGRLSESSSTPLNIVITHPSSSSYIRFDGTFQSTNKVLNGNVIVESENLSKFINSNIPSFKIPNKYNLKSALGFDIELNQQNLSLSNIVLKYGDKTTGSGNLHMPRDVEQPLIETTFNFTDIDLSVIQSIIKDFLSQKNNLKNLPQTSVAGEIHALRIHHEEQQLRDFEMSFEYVEQALNIKKSKILLPGNTDLSTSGNIFVVNDLLNYKGNVDVRTENLSQTLKWLNIEPKQVTPTVYKNMILSAQFSGNIDRFQIAPFKITLDKSTVTGEAGIVLGDKKDIMVTAQADSINFDNYISSLPDEIKQKSWLERILYRFQKTDFLNNIDLVLDTKADLIIYENMPFEHTKLKGNILNQVAEIENFSIDKIANSQIVAHGKISGFGNIPVFDNFNYNIHSTDITSLINKLELKVPDLEYKRFNNLDATGSLNGELNKLTATANITIGNLQADYSGEIVNLEKIPAFNGSVNLKHPSINQFLENIQSSYSPTIDNLGLFQFKADIQGSLTDYSLNNMNINIGPIDIQGKLSLDTINDKPNYIGEFDFNRLDIAKFLPKNKNISASIEKNNDTQSAFLPRPHMSDNIIDYELYRKANVKATIKSAEMIWLDNLIKDCSFNLEIFNNTLSIKEFSGIYNETPLNNELSITMDDNPSVTLIGSITDAEVNNFMLTGKTYGIRDGKFSTQWNLKSSAQSLDSFWKNLNGSAEIKVLNPTVNGINTLLIYKDLLERKDNSGLSETVRDALKSGQSPFHDISGKINITDGKFTIADASMTADNLQIKMYGDGDLGDWTMNTIFNAKFAQPQYLPEFSFMLKESIANPSLEINVDSLFQFYKSKADRKFAEIEQHNRDTQNKRIDAFEEQKKIADNLVAEAREILEKNIEEKMQTAYSDKSQARYTALKQELSNYLANLVEKITSYDITKIQDSDIIEADQTNKDARKNIQDLSSKLRNIYLDDLKIQTENYNNQITEEYNLLKQLSFYFSSLSEKYKDRLSTIKTDYHIENNQEYNDKQDEFLTKFAFLEKMNQDLAEFYQKSPKNTIEHYEQLNLELNDRLAKIKAEREELKNNIDIFDAQEIQKIDNEEELYLEQKEKEKDKLLLQENSGSIRVKKSGKLIKVNRDLEEIKNIQEEVSQDKIRVLDFTKEKINISSPTSPKVGVVKKGSNLIAN